MEDKKAIENMDGLSNASESSARPTIPATEEIQETDRLGTLGVFGAIASFIPGIVYIISGGTEFLGVFVWILIAIGFILSFLGMMISKTKEFSLTGLVLCVITAMFAIIYPQIDLISSYIEEMSQINLFNPQSPLYE